MPRTIQVFHALEQWILSKTLCNSFYYSHLREETASDRISNLSYITDLDSKWQSWASNTSLRDSKTHVLKKKKKISLGKWDTLKSNLYSWFRNESRTKRVNNSSLSVEQFIQEPMCIFLLKGFWSLLWNEVSSWRAAGRGRLVRGRPDTPSAHCRGLPPRWSILLAGPWALQLSPG